MLNLMPNFNLERDPADPDPEGKFALYQIDSYLLNSLGSIPSEFLRVVVFASFLKYVNLNPFFLIKHKHIALLIYFLQRMFVWNFVFVVLLSNFQKLCVYTMVSIRLVTSSVIILPESTPKWFPTLPPLLEKANGEGSSVKRSSKSGIDDVQTIFKQEESIPNLFDSPTKKPETKCPKGSPNYYKCVLDEIS